MQQQNNKRLKSDFYHVGKVEDFQEEDYHFYTLDDSEGYISRVEDIRSLLESIDVILKEEDYILAKEFDSYLTNGERFLFMSNIVPHLSKDVYEYRIEEELGQCEYCSAQEATTMYSIYADLVEYPVCDDCHEMLSRVNEVDEMNKPTLQQSIASLLMEKDSVEVDDIRFVSFEEEGVTKVFVESVEESPIQFKFHRKDLGNSVISKVPQFEIRLYNLINEIENLIAEYQKN
jgi:hypothetical protein